MDKRLNNCSFSMHELGYPGSTGWYPMYAKPASRITFKSV